MDWSDYEVDGQLSIFDCTDDNEQFKPKKSTDWKWSFSDYPKEKNGLKVFSCFACGGGSTMGYKLCGCEVLGCCEIDRQQLGYVSKETLIAAQTFPKDYDFMPDSYSNVGYILGMSVPPLMIKRLVTKLIEQGVYDYKLRKLETR